MDLTLESYIDKAAQKCLDGGLATVLPTPGTLTREYKHGFVGVTGEEWR
jgi:hypothetical protein